MSLAKSLVILFIASACFIVSTVIAQDKLARIDRVVATKPLISDEALFAGLAKPLHGLAGLPLDLKDDETLFTVESSDSREPASTAAKTPSNTKADWASATTDGFEYKMHVKQQVSAVWVLKRNDHFDLIFANSNGSRVNLTIPAEQFYALKSAATDLRAPASDTSKCKDNFVELEMVEMNSRKLVSTCLATKGKPADDLRQFGAVLTAFVR